MGLKLVNFQETRSQNIDKSCLPASPSYTLKRDQKAINASVETWTSLHGKFDRYMKPKEDQLPICMIMEKHQRKRSRMISIRRKQPACFQVIYFLLYLEFFNRMLTTWCKASVCWYASHHDELIIMCIWAGFHNAQILFFWDWT